MNTVQNPQLDKQVRIIFNGFLKEFRVNASRCWRACSSEHYAQEVLNLPEFGQFIMGEGNGMSIHDLVVSSNFKGILHNFCGISLPIIYIKLGQLCQKYIETQYRLARKQISESNLEYDCVDLCIQTEVFMVEVLKSVIQSSFSPILGYSTQNTMNNSWSNQLRFDLVNSGNQNKSKN